MGCTGSTNALPPANVPTPVAFVVPIHEQDENPVKKQLPKKFQKLEKQSSPPVLTHKMLQDKLADAEQRRLQILDQRIESAKILMQPRFANGDVKSTDTTQVIDTED